MGLDMYFFAHATKQEQTENLVAPGTHHTETQIGYFRKFYPLNNFLGTLYPAGIEDFNCGGLEITPDVLEQIRAWANDYRPEEKWDVQWHTYLKAHVIPSVQNAFAEGRPVYYVPWW